MVGFSVSLHQLLGRGRNDYIVSAIGRRALVDPLHPVALGPVRCSRSLVDGQYFDCMSVEDVCCYSLRGARAIGAVGIGAAFYRRDMLIFTYYLIT